MSAHVTANLMKLSRCFVPKMNQSNGKMTPNHWHLRAHVGEGLACDTSDTLCIGVQREGRIQKGWYVTIKLGREQLVASVSICTDLKPVSSSRLCGMFPLSHVSMKQRKLVGKKPHIPHTQGWKKMYWCK